VDDRRPPDGVVFSAFRTLTLSVGAFGVVERYPPQDAGLTTDTELAGVRSAVGHDLRDVVRRDNSPMSKFVAFSVCNSAASPFEFGKLWITIWVGWQMREPW